MPRLDIVRQIKIIKTPRLMQLHGIFDIPPSEISIEKWCVDFELPKVWNIGLIVGPSGCGKTTIAQELFKENLAKEFIWSKDKSILDDFPKHMSIKEICGLLSSVGFSSPPAWMRPFHVLSNGEQFRVNIARIIAEQKTMAVVDEFTSVVDRTVAKIGSAAIAKTVRQRNQKFVAVSCHYDIAEWLEPDWIYQPATNEFVGGRLLQRPKINLEIKRIHSSAWQLFRKHHYLNSSINTSAICFCAFWDGVAVAFTAVLHFPHPRRKNTKREHRTVCLPDYQGVGIGNAMSAYVGSLCKGLGYSFVSATSHPAMIKTRAKLHDWKLIRNASRTAHIGKTSSQSWVHATDRYTVSFEYVGCATSKQEAQKIWNITN